MGILLVSIGLFLMLLETRNVLRESRETVRITNQELPEILRLTRKTLEDLQEAANSVNKVATSIAAVSDAVANISKKIKGGWGSGIATGIDLIKKLFRR